MKRWIHASTGSRGTRMLGNIVNRVEWEIRGGLNPQEAIIKVCDELGYAHDDESDKVYNYLLSRFGVPVTASTEEDDGWEHEYSSELDCSFDTKEWPEGEATIHSFDNDGDWGYSLQITFADGKKINKTAYGDNSLDRLKKYAENEFSAESLAHYENYKQAKAAFASEDTFDPKEELGR